MTVDTSLTFEFRDEYNRKPIAEKIIRLLESEVDVSPLVIDGGWGTGKSEFCHKLINLLESNKETKLRAVYIDAFKADHANEPLMTLLASVLKLLPEAEQKTLIKKALPAIRFATKTVLKSAVSWVLKQDATDMADDFEGVLKDAGDDVINHTIESALADHVKADESMQTLREALKEIAKDSPIVFFVDELDRCRPDFSISMLESIKHVFDVEGVQFVLVVNTKQLKASVNHCYGDNVNPEEYLNKFIGFKFVFPKVIHKDSSDRKFAPQEHFLVSVKKSKILTGSIFTNEVIDSVLIAKTASYNEFRFFEKEVDRSERVFSFAKELIELHSLSLREVESFVQYIEVYQVLSDSKGFESDMLLGDALLNVLGVFIGYFKPKYIADSSNWVAQTLEKKPFLEGKTLRETIATVLHFSTVKPSWRLNDEQEAHKRVVESYFRGKEIIGFDFTAQVIAVADSVCVGIDG